MNEFFNIKTISGKLVISFLVMAALIALYALSGLLGIVAQKIAAIVCGILCVEGLILYLINIDKYKLSEKEELDEKLK